MIIDQRRSRRHNEYLPAIVNSIDGTTRSILAGPFSSRILDISMHGACLLMTQVIQGQYHVFYSTRENDSRLIELVLTLPQEGHQKTMHLLSRPVWMDLFCHKNIRAFKIGIDFIINPTGKQMREIQTRLNHKRKLRSARWSNAMLGSSPKRTARKGKTMW